MDKVKKRIVCMLLCVVLLASLLPAAFAEDTVTADDTAEVGKTVKFSYTAGQLFSNAGAITVNFSFDPTELQLVSVTASPISGVSAVSFGSAEIATANEKGIFGACWVDPNLGMTAAADDVLLVANFKALKAEAPSIKVEEASFHAVSESDLSQVVEVLTDAVNISADAQKTLIEIIARLAGDADGSGRVTPRDATVILQWLADAEGYNVTIDQSSSDVDANNRVTPRDATLILQWLADAEGYNVTLK